jgi:hypothetical protein
LSAQSDAGLMAVWVGQVNGFPVFFKRLIGGKFHFGADGKREARFDFVLLADSIQKIQPEFPLGKGKLWPRATTI